MKLVFQCKVQSRRSLEAPVDLLCRRPPANLTLTAVNIEIFKIGLNSNHCITVDKVAYVPYINQTVSGFQLFPAKYWAGFYSNACGTCSCSRPLPSFFPPVAVLFPRGACLFPRRSPCRACLLPAQCMPVQVRRRLYSRALVGRQKCPFQ